MVEHRLNGRQASNQTFGLKLKTPEAAYTLKPKPYNTYKACRRQIRSPKCCTLTLLKALRGFPDRCFEDQGFVFQGHSRMFLTSGVGSVGAVRGRNAHLLGALHRKPRNPKPCYLNPMFEPQTHSPGSRLDLGSMTQMPQPESEAQTTGTQIKALFQADKRPTWENSWPHPSRTLAKGTGLAPVSVTSWPPLLVLRLVAT